MSDSSALEADERAAVIERVASLVLTVSVSHPTRVAIDGITAAGKTTFARELAGMVRDHGRPCMHVSMDGFHNPRAIRHRQGRESAVGYYEDAYDFGALRRELLDPLGPGGDGRFRTAIIDLATDAAVAMDARRAEPDLVVIVDGSFLQRAELRGAWDAVVFLRASFEAAAARGAARDASQFGSLAAAEHAFTTRYHAAQRRYLAEADPEAHADVVIDNDDPRAPVIVRSLRTR